MKTKTALLLLLLCYSNAFGQSPGWSVGINVSPDLCYRVLKPDYTSIGHQTTSSPKLGYHAGLAIMYKTSRAFSFETGVAVVNRGHRVKHHEDDPAASWAHLTKLSLNLLGIPLTANVHLGQGKLKFTGSLSAMPAINFFSRSVLTIHSNDKTTDIEQSGFDNMHFYLSTALRAGGSYNITDKLELRVQPEFSMAFSSGNIQHFWSAGLHFGIYHAF